MKKITVNIGFITNSSSVVHHFPKEVLEHPKVKSFIETYGIQNGFVGKDMWRRDECTTLAVTKEQKKDVRNQMDYGSDYCNGPSIDVDSDDIVLVYGDEYSTIVQALMAVIGEAMPDVVSYGSDYN